MCENEETLETSMVMHIPYNLGLVVLKHDSYRIPTVSYVHDLQRKNKNMRIDVTCVPVNPQKAKDGFMFCALCSSRNSVSPTPLAFVLWRVLARFHTIVGWRYITISFVSIVPFSS